MLRQPSAQPKRVSAYRSFLIGTLALTCLFLIHHPARGQDSANKDSPNKDAANQSVTTMSVDVKVVSLPVTVRDKKGQIIRDLTADDFVLQEDGHPETIKYFNLDTNLPLTLGLLVDTSLSQRTVLNDEREASKTFVDQMLTSDKDKAFLIHFDHEIELLQDLTSSREQLKSALELLQTPSQQRDDSNSPEQTPGQGRSPRGAGTRLYDAIYLASTENGLMKTQKGRKALILLTDGADRGSKETLETAIESAQRADTVVYSILFVGKREQDNSGYGPGNGGRRRGGWPGGGGGGYPGGGGGYPGGGGGYPGGGGGYPGGGGGGRGGNRYPQEARIDGKKVLERISKETGGRMYEVSKKEPINQIYASISEELRSQYNLGYTPDKANASTGGYHKISLVAKKKDLTVQTRDGYYADR